MKAEIKDDCTSQFQISITRGWANLFIFPHADDIIQTQSSPSEERR
jgi:hypothetical protein